MAMKMFLKNMAMSTLAALLLAACSMDDVSDPQGTTDGEMLQLSSMVRRSPAIVPTTDQSIEIYVTRDTEARRGSFSYATDLAEWRSNVRVLPNENQYLYGFMPATAASSTAISYLSDGYAKGAMLTINNLDPMTPVDLCFLAGVKGGEPVSSSENITLWRYLYEGQPKNHNKVNLLMEHLYASLSLRLLVGSDYDILRTIKVKKIQLKVAGARKVNVSITQWNGLEPLFNYTTTETAVEVTDMLNSSEGETLSTSVPLVVNDFYVAPILTGLKLVSFYDVYDKEGHLVRKDCRAENDITGLMSMRDGTKTTLTMTVAPSYLYYLADPDALDPTIVKE